MEQQKMSDVEKAKKNNFPIVLSIIFGIALVGALGYIIYDKLAGEEVSNAETKCAIAKDEDESPSVSEVIKLQRTGFISVGGFYTVYVTSDGEAYMTVNESDLVGYNVVSGNDLDGVGVAGEYVISSKKLGAQEEDLGDVTIKGYKLNLSDVVYATQNISSGYSGGTQYHVVAFVDAAGNLSILSACPQGGCLEWSGNESTAVKNFVLYNNVETNVAAISTVIAGNLDEWSSTIVNYRDGSVKYFNWQDHEIRNG